MPSSGSPRGSRTGAPPGDAEWAGIVFQALRSLGAGLLIADAGTIVFANESAGAALGLDPAALRGRSVAELLPGALSGTTPSPETAGDRSTCRIRRPDGKETVLTVQGVEVPHPHREAEPRQFRRQVDDGGGFATAAFMVGDRDGCCGF